MALGVDGVRTGRVVTKVCLLTLGTFIFVVSLTLLYESMRAVMDVGGACASGGAYQIRQQCPEGVAWVMPVSIFGMMIGAGITFLGAFSEGGPRPYVFAWSALFLALGWNFLDYGFDAPGGGTEAGWLVCGFVFVAMGGLPLLLLLKPSVTRWALWGPKSSRPDEYLQPYRPPPTAPAGSPAAAPVDPEPTPAPPRWQSTTLPLPTASVALPTIAHSVPEPAVEPRSAPATRPGVEVVDRLSTLADLRERGLLDAEEYEKAKDAVLRDAEEPS